MDNSRRRIASLALFRNLYNEGKSDIMTILCEFARNIVYNKQLKVFTPTQIRDGLKTEYEFYIPEYVVESVLKKFCKKTGSMYVPNTDDVPQKVNEQEIERIEKSHERILLELVSYIEKKTDKKLADKEKERLFQSFCGFLIDESDIEYGEYISAFVIETQTDKELSELFRTIKEGVVLYTGIQYNDNVNETGSWKEDFTIFLEQEILFHFAGFNGELYQQLFQDFFGLVKEVNQKAHKQLIKVKYFDSVRFEIENFFNIAERIVEGKDTLDCSNIAMTAIVQGCEHKSDVVAKKCAFFDLLNKNLISEENGSSFYNENSKFNIFYDENLTKISNDFPDRDVEWSLQLLNYISMIRKGNMSGFDKSKCILLTGNSTTMAVALHPLIKQNGDVPLATTLDYITNRLWFKLNKGFGSGFYPKSFSIVTKAQIVLSTQVVGSVAQEFEKIKKEITEKSKPESVIIAELAELKTKVKKPEEIKSNDTDEILNTITIADTERYLREREMEKNEAEKTKMENERLNSEIIRINKEKEESAISATQTISQKETERDYYKERYRESLKTQIMEIEKKKQEADNIIDKWIKRIKWIPWTVIVLFILIVVFSICRYGWDKMEPITWIISIIIASMPYLFFAIGAKSYNPQKYINLVCKGKYKNKIYKKFGVDLQKLESLKQKIEDL